MMYEVYKDYDANAPDTPAVLITEDKEVAEAAAAFLNDLKEREMDGSLAYDEGHEWCAWWRVREYHAPTQVSTIEEAKDVLFGDLDYVIAEENEIDLDDKEAVRAAFDEMWS